MQHPANLAHGALFGSAARHPACPPDCRLNLRSSRRRSTAPTNGCAMSEQISVGNTEEPTSDQINSLIWETKCEES